MQKIVALCGPTASGKTSLGIMLASRFNGEIVSCDSRQIYRAMDVGTAKPTSVQQRAIPHHMIDTCCPGEDYSLAHFQSDARGIIADIFSRHHVPFLVGGTGLYMDAVLYNTTLPSASPDKKWREHIEERIAREGLEKVFEELCEADPKARDIIDGKNPRRVVRALEIQKETGKPFSSTRELPSPAYDFLKIGIACDLETINERILQRTQHMMQCNLVEEVQSLVKKYGELPLFKDTIGYAEIIDYLHGALSLPDAQEKIWKNSVSYAKRQMTWFKKDTRTLWVQTYEEAFARVEKFLR